MKIKGLTALLLALLLVFCCACGTEEEKKEQEKEPEPVFDRLSAIEPLAQSSDKTLKNGDETVTLSHIDTDSDPEDAETILNFAYDALSSADSTGTVNITGMFRAALGLAGNDFSFEPVLIETTSDSVNADPIYMVLFSDSTGGPVLLGSFRESQVKDTNYRAASQSLLTQAESSVRNAFAYKDDSNEIKFNLARVYGYSFSPVNTEFSEIYDDICDRYFTYMFAGWPLSDSSSNLQIDGIYFQKLDYDSIKTYDDLTAYLAKGFTQELAELIRSSSDKKLYASVGGNMYYAPVGIGGPLDIENTVPKYVAVNGDEALMIVECTRVDFDDDFNITRRYYEEYLFTFVKEGDSWKCSYFTDISFGMI